MSGIFGRSSALSGDPWDVPAILDAWSTPATLENQPPADSGPAPRTQCGEGETLDANTGACVKLTSTDVKTVVAPAAASSTSKLTFGQALPYVLGAAAAGVLLMVLMGKKKMTPNLRGRKLRIAAARLKGAGGKGSQESRRRKYAKKYHLPMGSSWVTIERERRRRIHKRTTDAIKTVFHRPGYRRDR